MLGLGVPELLLILMVGVFWVGVAGVVYLIVRLAARHGARDAMRQERQDSGGPR
ncbi:hypothetical protein GCM10022221_17000 [Actinocorallia aurea]